MTARKEWRPTPPLVGPETRSHATEPREADFSTVGDAGENTQHAEVEGRGRRSGLEPDAEWQVVTTRRGQRDRSTVSRSRGREKGGSEEFYEPIFSTRRGELSLSPKGPRAPDSPWLPPLDPRNPKLVSDTIYRHLEVEELTITGDEGDSFEEPSPSLREARLPPSDKGAASDELGLAPACGRSTKTSVAKRRRRRRKLVGDLAAHASFLQFAFRRTTARWPGCWRRGGLAGKRWWRPVEAFACLGGFNLASDEAFEEQSRLASQALSWYRNYVYLLRRLESGRTPTALVTFCGQGGTSEGVKRAGGAAHGQDVHDQPRYRVRFGQDNFTKGDSTDASGVRDLLKRARAFVILSSPPCKAYSTARMRGEASEEPMIAQTRDANRETGKLSVIENVVGAHVDMRAHACILRGSFFGLHVDRPRLFEANFDLHVDRVLRDRGLTLRKGTCLGVRRRWRRLDPFGRPSLCDCCDGNLWAVQGDKPLRCTACECADAMGLDQDHMDYDGMAQAIPPAYGEYVFGQAAMREVERKYGLEAITFDEMLARPERSRRLMRHWLRGAGGVSPDQGVEFATTCSARSLEPSVEPEEPHPKSRADGGGGEAMAASDGASTRVDGAEAAAIASQGRGGIAPRTPTYSPLFSDETVSPVAEATEGSVVEAEARELFYSWAGDFDQAACPIRWWAPMAEVKKVERRSLEEVAERLAGRNTLVMTGRSGVGGWIGRARRAMASSPNTRITIRALSTLDEEMLKRAGFELVRRIWSGTPAYGSSQAAARLPSGGSFWSAGVERSAGGGEIDYAALESHMDPRDWAGAPKEPATAKAGRSYVPIPWEKERWDVGLPSELDEIMARRGVGIYPWEEHPPTEVPFYKWANDEGLLKSIAEADRAILAGAMEYVPAHRVKEVLESSTIHPWTIVDQGGGKWRLCHDYSVGTNRIVPSASFALPSVWDVRKCVTPTSCFAKYDIRDGFWHVPIAEDSKRRLVVRHPGTGRLIWATRLPFGYIDSPRIFCALTEAVMARLRKRAAGKGIHFFVFVDDCLCVGDTEELTREGMEMLEAEMEALGLQVAPNKSRGPCKCIEFLGLLLSNVKGARGITITKKRRTKLEEEMARWLAMKPVGGNLAVDPRELASFLGKLVFVSQVVQGGRTYMQGMLAQFKGMIVDWRRGEVKPTEGRWGRMEVTTGFWRDLAWWKENLQYQSLAPMDPEPRRAEAVLTGTDASDWGTGQVIWLDGGREESVLKFTAAERRRPINWRELLGILRVCELGGERLRGKVVLIETDNMAARGATANMASKSEEMQELVRRLLRTAAKHGFTVRVTHTPGEKLDRPDQTSRGDAVEEPRFRLRKDIFNAVSSRFGPFSSFIGAEREFTTGGERTEMAEKRLWVHPTFNSVGSALRRVQEEIASDMAAHTCAVALVPDDSSAAWSTMLRHGLILGRWEQGAPCLEANELGQWLPVRTHRPSCLVLFPRAAGAAPRRLAEASGERLLTAMPGSYAYAMAADGGVGNLVRVVSDDGDGVLVEYLALDKSKAARKASRGPVFILEKLGGSNTWLADPTELWTVDHLVTKLTASASGRVTRVHFEYHEANAEIVRRGGAWQEPRAGWAEAETPARTPAVSQASPVSDARSTDYDLGGHGMGAYSPFGMGEMETRLAEVELEEAVESVRDDAAKRHAANRGPEGRVATRGMEIRGGTPEGQTGPVQQPCPYAGMTCGGCKEALTLGETVETRQHYLVHCRDECRVAADKNAEVEADAEQARLSLPRRFYGLYSDSVGISGVYSDWEEVAQIRDESCDQLEAFGTYEEATAFVKSCTSSRASGALLAQGIRGSLVKRAHLDERLSSSVLSRIEACVAGRCGQPHDETSTACLGGCGAKLHVSTCAQMGKGFEALGNFRCLDCRLKEVMVSGDPSEASSEVRTTVARTMVLELGQGKESTAASYAEYTRLEEKYALGFGRVLDGKVLNLPRHSVEAFKNFCTWMVLTEERARSLESTVRTAGAMMVKLGLTDVTKSGAVKAHVKDLLVGSSMEHEPATTATSRMLKLIVEKVIDERYPDPFISAREKVQFIAEAVGGCRIGEVCGGGDSHGLLANNVAILEDSEASRDELGRVVVEAKLEHSKTGFSRHLDMAGCTRTSGINCAEIMENYWKAAGFKTVSYMQAGVRVTRPDFWVVRVSLNGLAEADLMRLFKALEKSKCSDAKKHLGRTRIDSRTRWVASGAESREKRYINVASGTAGCVELKELLEGLKAQGFTATQVPGPLLLATTGGKRPTKRIMPLSTSTAFAPTKELLVRAWKELMGDDPDLDLPPGQEPKWSTHSLRRLADTTARRYMELTGVTEDQIDIYFGWHEKVLLKAMQVHYASLSIRERMRLAKITGMM